MVYLLHNSKILSIEQPLRGDKVTNVLKGVITTYKCNIIAKQKKAMRVYLFKNTMQLGISIGENLYLFNGSITRVSEHTIEITKDNPLYNIISTDINTISWYERIYESRN